MRRFLPALLLSILLLPLPAAANDDATDQSVTLLREIQHFTVQRDGSYVSTNERYVQLHDQRAVQNEAQYSISYNASTEQLDVLEAFTEKPDGRKVAVPAQQIKVQQEPAYSGAPMFQDLLVKVVIFSDVSLDDKLFLKWRRTVKEPVFAGNFWDVDYPRFKPTRQLTLVYELPSDMRLVVDADGYAASAPVVAGGRTSYRFDYTPSPNARFETGAVDYSDYGRHLVVSTMPDYATLGKAYDRGAAAAAAITPAIAARAREIVAGITDQRAQAIAINQWVRTNIRYVAVYIGRGGFVPHSADSVLANRFGDCKDHATLMEALLRVAGIESTPVLINSGNAYRLSPATNPYAFNHAITYIPALDLYLDSTASNIEGGYLPESELGKTVLLTRSATLGHTPLAQYGTVRNHFTVAIDASGGARFAFSRRNDGWLAELVRNEHMYWREADRNAHVETLLKWRGMKGSGSVTLGDLSGGKEYSYSFQGETEDLTYLPGTVGVPALTGMNAGIDQQLYPYFGEATRSQPYICPAFDFAEQADYTLPPGATLLALPADVTVDGRVLRYRSHYERSKDGLRITRSVVAGKPDSRVCTPQDHDAMRADLRAIVRDLRAQFILQSAPPALASASTALSSPKKK